MSEEELGSGLFGDSACEHGFQDMLWGTVESMQTLKPEHVALATRQSPYAFVPLKAFLAVFVKELLTNLHVIPWHNRQLVLWIYVHHSCPKYALYRSAESSWWNEILLQH